MKVVLQSEAAECGLACMAMVASAHGLHLQLSELRQRCVLSMKGMNLSRLMGVADALGLQARALRVELEQLPRLRLPCILHWGMNHFVVLERVGRRDVSVIDPAFGRRRLSLQEVSAQFSGVALELSPGAQFSRRAALPAVRLSELTGRLVGIGRSLGLILLLSLALQVFVMSAPFLLQWVIDQVLVTADLDLLLLLGVGFALLLLMQVAVTVLRGWAVIWLSARLGLQWTAQVFGHLLKLPLEFFQKRHLGDVTSRMASVRSIQNTLTHSAVEAVIDGLMAMAVLSMMVLYSWKLALVTVLAMLLYLGVRLLAFHAMRSASEQQIVASAQQQSHLLESIRGMQSLKVAGIEAMRQSRYLNLLQTSTDREVQVARLQVGLSSANALILGGERIAVVWIGALLALAGGFSVGMLIAYLAYRELFSQRMSGLIDKCMEFRMLRLHGERLADIVRAEPEPQSALGAAVELPAQCSIEVRNLGFRYAEGEPWVLRGLSFRIEAGQALAIIGHSGCGKSTLLKLLLGLLKPSEGSIEVAGVELGRLGPRAFRAHVGAVMQDDQLFAGSIAENIALNAQEPDESRILQAARLAAIDQEIASMPMGYHSLIGDMGTSLSGGQKQRVILARALYREPRILFLDEATSHLDVACERLVNSAVQQLRITRVIVAHRPQTIASADRVLELRDGQVLRDYTPQPVDVDAMVTETVPASHACRLEAVA